jgi:hypothetical protein
MLHPADAEGGERGEEGEADLKFICKFLYLTKVIIIFKIPVYSYFFDDLTSGGPDKIFKPY